MNRMKSLLLAGGIAALAFAASATLPAFANGGDFFNELSESWGANVDTGVPFFGWVRDAKGKAIARAIVTATVQNGADGEAVTIITDNLGHFRIPGLGKEVNPKDVVVECAKVGYRAVSQDRRVMRTLPKAPIEVDCKLLQQSVPTS
ncbi:MAG TPA: carboxypeptidase-like regulatory domain-containing protein [Micropepsaceae bacterium]|jgi:hypothetical protein|nr:carboxypeptidase-like regulatory domain-containing protein [Micropepsaceae bacterium]